MDGCGQVWEGGVAGDIYIARDRRASCVQRSKSQNEEDEADGDGFLV